MRDAYVAFLAGVFEDLPGTRVRAVPPINWHWTLRFLGHLDDEQAGNAVRALDRAVDGLGPPFELDNAELGAFPNGARARAVWLAPRRGEGRDALLALHRRVSVPFANLEAQGLLPRTDPGSPPRPFRPHLTLARLRPPIDLRARLHSWQPNASLPNARIRELVLVRSHLGHSTPRYETLASWPLRRTDDENRTSG